MFFYSTTSPIAHFFILLYELLVLQMSGVKWLGEAASQDDVQKLHSVVQLFLEQLHCTTNTVL